MVTREPVLLVGGHQAPVGVDGNPGLGVVEPAELAEELLGPLESADQISRFAHAGRDDQMAIVTCSWHGWRYDVITRAR